MLFNYVNIPAIFQYFEGAVPSDIEGRNIAIILWTCLLPLTCCIWTYLHPNIPSRNLRLDGLGERLKLMLLMVVAPELILIWAVRQFVAAREIMVTYNKERSGSWQWSIIHGHFLSMGGYVLKWVGEPTKLGRYLFRAQFEILSFERFKELLKDPNFKFPPTTTADLEDKSKRSSMLICLTTFFVGRFILQLSARVEQELALTQFELHIFALVIVSFVVGAFWWDKPWDVKIPIGIDPPMNLGTEKALNDLKSADDEGADTDKNADKKRVDLESNRLLNSTPFMTPLNIRSFLSFASIPSTIALRVATTSEIPPGAKQVPRLYAPKTSSDEYSHLITFALFGVLFGGIHCIGWNFTYLSESERTLWRFTSLAITVMPSIIAPIQYILANRKPKEGERIAMVLSLYVVVNMLLLIYVSARLSLVAQTLSLLKKQPSDAFLEVDWLRYIPRPILVKMGYSLCK